MNRTYHRPPGKLLENLIAESTEAMYVVDGGERIRAWNGAAEKLFGWRREEVLDRRITDLPVLCILPPADASGKPAAGGRSSAWRAPASLPLHVHGRHRDGRKLSLELRVLPSPAHGEGATLWMLCDRTGQAQLEDRAGIQQDVASILAESPRLDDALPGILAAVCRHHPWTFGGYWEDENGSGDFRCRHLHYLPDGRLEAFARRTRELRLRNGEGLLGRVGMSRQREWIEDVRGNPRFLRAREAETAGLVSAVGFPVLDGEELCGIFEFYSGIRWQPDASFLDLLQALSRQLSQFLARKKAEEILRRNEERLRQAAKMEAIGRLAGGIAHEFNNLLTTVIGYSDLLLTSKVSGKESERRMLADIKAAGERAAQRTAQLLAYSGQQVLQPGRLSLNDILEGMEGEYRRLLGKAVELELRLDPDLRLVRMDRVQLEQVLVNLVLNARDAMPGGGRLVLETHNAPAPSAGAAPQGPAGPAVVLSVSDTGAGMDRETLARIFDPYFTTKPFGQNSGLGLCTVEGIVRQSGGMITVRSAKGRGSAFRIRLPAVEASTLPAATAPQEADSGPRGPRATILLAEDEPAVRKFLHGVLAEQGFHVLQAGDGEEALRLQRGFPGPIDLLVTDIVMPHMGGLELAAALRKERPGIKILFLSGYGDSAAAEPLVSGESRDFLGKPFEARILLDKLGRLLSAPVGV